MKQYNLTLLHSERPKLYGVLAILSATGLRKSKSAIFISASFLNRGQFLNDSLESVPIQLNSPMFNTVMYEIFISEDDFHIQEMTFISGDNFHKSFRR